MEQIMQAGAVAEQAAKRNKWVDGVLKLIYLTQNGALNWTLADVSDPAFAYAYQAEFEGNTVKLERTLMVDPRGEMNSLVRSAMIGLFRQNTSEKIVLKVQKPDGTLVTQFPMISPLRGLVAAVEAQVSRESDAFLDTLASA